MSREDALKAALDAVKVSGLLTALTKIVAEVCPQSFFEWIRGVSRRLRSEDAKKLSGIVKSYDVEVSEAAIKFERRS